MSVFSCVTKGVSLDDDVFVVLSFFIFTFLVVKLACRFSPLGTSLKFSIVNPSLLSFSIVAIKLRIGIYSPTTVKFILLPLGV